MVMVEITRSSSLVEGFKKWIPKDERAGAEMYRATIDQKNQSVEKEKIHVPQKNKQLIKRSRGFDLER